jgi:hypothetical protein
VSDKHKRGKRKGQFCAIPCEKICDDCPGTKNYIKVCKPGWAAHTFLRLVKRAVKKGGSFTFGKMYEAHHVLCVAPVSQNLVSKRSIEKVIRQTQWCINNKKNMLAMPLWGHTVKWYCSIDRTGGEIEEDVDAPPFKNIPQHDYDHNCEKGYTWEIEQEAKKLAKDIEDAEHDMAGDDLAGTLNDLSDEYVKVLKKRGGRKDGTHNAWSLAQNTPPDDEWFYPFSMASDPTVKAFPAKNFDESVQKWIDRIATAIASGV